MRQQQQCPEAGPQARVRLLAQRGKDGLSDAFGSLERHVADEAVGDHHIHAPGTGRCPRLAHEVQGSAAQTADGQPEPGHALVGSSPLLSRPMRGRPPRAPAGRTRRPWARTGAATPAGSRPWLRRRPARCAPRAREDGADPGRAMPRIRRNVNRAAARVAPLLPAEDMRRGPGLGNQPVSPPPRCWTAADSAPLRGVLRPWRSPSRRDDLHALQAVGRWAAPNGGPPLIE